MKEMVGGCCVCSDERGFYENPLVYCDGQGCNVAVHQACYGIVQVPTGPWYCRKCESQERTSKVRCELCPSRDGALKSTDNGHWAHVVCALYIPEVRFGNNNTMEPIILQLVPPERYSRICSICEEQGKEEKSKVGACMQCNKMGCRQYFHVTCAQAEGLLCEEAGNNMDNVKYCGYCSHHYQKLKKEGGNIKPIPAFKPIPNDNSTPDSSPEKFSPSRQTANASIINDIKLAKKKSGKSSSVSSNASIASPNSLHSNSNHGSLPTKCNPITSDMIINKIKSEMIGDESNGNTLKSNATSPLIDTFDKCVTDKKKKKSVASSASASPQSSRPPLTPTPPAVTQNSETKSPSGAHFYLNPSILSSALNAATDRQFEPQKTSFSQFTQNSNLLKRAKIDNGMIDKKKIRKQITPTIKTKSAAKDFGDVKALPVKKIRKKKTESLMHTTSGMSIPVNQTNLTPLQNGYTTMQSTLANSIAQNASQSTTLSSTSSLFTSVNTLNGCIGPNLFSQEHSGPLPSSSKSLSNSTAKQNEYECPQTLEQLLERQWSQGQQFILDQAQHFDIASLLSCLHQLRNENNRLEERVRDLATRRDQLLAVNARLSLPPNNVFPINGALGSFNSEGMSNTQQSPSHASAPQGLSAASSPHMQTNSPQICADNFQNKNIRVSSPAQAINSQSPVRNHSTPFQTSTDALTFASHSHQHSSQMSYNLPLFSANSVSMQSPSTSSSPHSSLHYFSSHQQNASCIRKNNNSDNKR